MMENLYPYWVFAMVVRQHGLTRAAAELGISQPAVSAHIKGLETKFGERLLNRGGKQTRPTPFGEEVYARVLPLLAAVEELNWLAHGNSSLTEVVIAASQTPGAYWLPARLKEFEALECIRCSYRIGDSRQVHEWIRDYSVPFGIVGDLPEATSSDFDQVEIGRDRLQLMVAASHPLSGKRRVCANAFGQERLILRTCGSSTRAQAETMLATCLRNFSSVLEFNNGEAIKEAVLAGFGLAVLSSWSVVREVDAGLLGVVGADRWCLNRPIHLLKLPQRRLRGNADLLWNFLSAPSKQ